MWGQAVLRILQRMLPLALTVKNFLSYREDVPTLHLENVHVACLCGANGHGKSALLDAITWALWGRARGRTHEQLIHEGQQDMMVELEFEEEGQHYRVVRRYSKARRAGQSSLELALASQDGWRPLTGDTVRQTEAAIERLVNMDYETFVNSAYLLQGRADLFTMSTPAARKNVLASVLGLGLYDRLSERAKVHAREAQGRLGLGDETLRRLEAQVGDRASVEALLAEADVELTKAEESGTTVEQELEAVRQQVAHSERRQQEIDELGAQSQRAVARREQAEQEVQGLGRRVGEWRRALERAAEIEDGYRLLQQARTRLAELNAAAQRVHALERELSPLTQQITAARVQLETEVATQDRRLQQEILPRAEALSGVEARLTAIADEAVALDVCAGELSAVVERQQAASIEARRIDAENVVLEAAGKDTRGKLELLVHDHGNGIACPLCGTGLGEEGRERLEVAYKTQIEEQRSRYQQQAVRVQTLDAEAKGLGAQLAGRQAELDGARRTLDQERARLIVQRDEALQARAKLDEVRTMLAESKSLLERSEFAQVAQARAATLRQQIAAAAFDTHALENLQRQTHERERWDAEHRRLSEAQGRLADDEVAFAGAQGRAAEATGEAARLDEQCARMAAELAGLSALRELQRATEERQRESARVREEQVGRRGALASRLDQIGAAEAELKEREAARIGLAEEVAAHNELGIAFGKGGVQALLIEAAIPRLEDEANGLLSRMTDGRMALQVHTQRDRRTAKGSDDDPVETLEITINDEIGKRAYEMYSGGERFRIDLALRIALSKLLAWRAGARLPTLFIDEGFGTQDAEGRDRIVGVIKAIEDQFQRILVITHMDEVKEAFPVRIEVSRTAAAGSTFSIS